MKATKLTQLFLLGVMMNILGCNSSDDNNPLPTGTPQKHCGAITSPTRWTNHTNGVDYIITCDFVVESDLVVEEGTEIVFENGTGMTIEPTGSLTVNGTAAKRVAIHGQNNLIGNWQGIWILSDNVKNSINYCEISGGGQASFNGHDVKANIRINDIAKLSLTNSFVNNSGRDGIYIDGLADGTTQPISVFTNNSFTNNTGAPINAIAPVISVLDGTGSTYIGNGKQYIQLRGGRLYGSHIWKKCSIPYGFTETVATGYYENEGDLVIQSGTSMKFANGAGITVGEYSNGYLRMEGNNSEHITLTPLNGGNWKGICFQSTNSQNLMSYVDIDRGGASSFTGNTSQLGNIVIGGYGNGYALLQNCHISNGAGYGIYITSSSTAPTLSNISYTSNALGNYYQQP